jgi:3D (Asp-Asp-Asp) domain-containing protein
MTYVESGFSRILTVGRSLWAVGGRPHMTYVESGFSRALGAAPSFSRALRVAPGFSRVAAALTALVLSAACSTPPVDAQESADDAVRASGAATIVAAGRERPFSVTAYCAGRITQSGARVKPGMAAADPRVLPVGSTIRVDGQGRAYDGVYTVTDTGREIKGRELDLYLSSCDEAEQFGRRTMRVAVIRRGWDPTALPGER